MYTTVSPPVDYDNLFPESLHNILVGTGEQLREVVLSGNRSFAFIDIKIYLNTLPRSHMKLFLCSLRGFLRMASGLEMGTASTPR
jgi:hypothetical protein